MDVSFFLLFFYTVAAQSDLKQEMLALFIAKLSTVAF